MSVFQDNSLLLLQQHKMEMCGYLHRLHKNDSAGYCNYNWDEVLCWPKSKVGSIIELPCPIMKGNDPSKTVRKYCKEDGDWEKSYNTTTSTNYTSCFTEEILHLYTIIKKMTAEDFALKIEIAKMVRILEIIGLTTSLLLLCMSFAIYYAFKKLRNERTRIHMNLFTAVTAFVIVKLMICIDQIIMGYDRVFPMYTGLDDTPIVCESVYIVLEYTKTCTFMWMFIEALHLHYAVAVAATKMSFKKYYLLLGWCFPAVFVTIWVTVMISQPRSHCWWAYNYNPIFWILEGPRILILIINTMFLINIVKVVFIKLRNSSSNEVDKIRKTLKATLVLLPLLGITNYLSYMEPELDCPLWLFIGFTLVTYTLTSFQGSAIGLLYCILNQEVKETVLSKFTSTSNSGGNSQPLPPNQERRNDEKMQSIENIIFA